MLHSAKRRIAVLERSIELPITAERFVASVLERVRLTGVSFEEASQSLLGALSYENLDRLEKELIQRGIGDGHGDEAMRSASIAMPSPSVKRTE
jgi:hypothetical protein